MNVKDRVAVITGAGSGIGRAIALSLAQRGCHLALADVNPAGLAETAEMAAKHGVRVSQHVLDVASREAVAALPAAVHATHGRVDLLVNNAGVALGGTFEQVSEADFDWLMEINFHGLVRMTRAFLPLLHKSDDARIVNISSLFGLVSLPLQSAYCASKFAVRGFSNSLRIELQMSGAKIGVTVVHPGGVATSIAKSARLPAGAPVEEVQQRLKQVDKLLRMPPSQAGEQIVRAVEQRRDRLIVGADAKITSVLERIAPVGYWSLLKRLLPTT